MLIYAKACIRSYAMIAALYGTLIRFTMNVSMEH